jgi:hypothetical protein
MRKILIIFSILLITSFTKAQDFKFLKLDSISIYPGISLGAVFPIGHFGSKAINVGDAGFAKTGGIINVNIDFKLMKYAGVTALIFGQINSVYSGAIANNTMRKFPGNNFSAETEFWKMIGAMAGIYGTYPFGKDEKFGLDLKCAAGLLNVSTPEIKMINTTEGTWTEEESEFAYAFIYSIGAKLKYKIVEKLSLTFELNYLSSKPEFNNMSYITSSGYKELRSYQQKMQELTTSIGVAYKFR